MFCQKCGNQNPDDGKFCRGCGAPLVAAALTNKKGKPVTWEGLITKFATGFAFLVISIILGTSGYAGGRNWWFWLLIPAFTMMGAGVAQYIQLRKSEAIGYVGGVHKEELPPSPQSRGLPPQHTFPAATPAESRFKTGDLVPPSVTDNTTRHLEMDTEGKTQSLPKKQTDA